MELALGAILLVLMYEKPYALTEMANSLLGKAVMIIGVGIIAKNNGLASGLLAALIMIILIHETVEGMTTKKADAEPDYKKLGYTQINDESAVEKALANVKITKVSDSGQCGPCVTQKAGTTCNVFIKPEKTKPTKPTKRGRWYLLVLARKG